MVDSVIMSQSHGSGAAKAQFSALDTAAERGTSDETKLHTCVHAHNLRILIRLEAVDCDGMRYAIQFDGGRSVHTHHTASLTLAPQMPCIRLVILLYNYYTGLICDRPRENQPNLILIQGKISSTYKLCRISG